VGFITTAPYASRPTLSWPPSALGFPPLSLCPSSEPLVSPRVSGRGALPVRPERYVASSIATFLRRHGRTLLQAHACLWCGREERTG